MSESQGRAAGRHVPNRPKSRPGQDLLTDPEQRQRLGAAYADHQSLQQARDYDAFRPPYPAEAVEAVLSLTPTPDGPISASKPPEYWGWRAKIGPHREGAPQIVELGAGTGILTRDLLAGGALVSAVEPSASMLQILRERAPAGAALHLVQAPAEQTGLADSQADVVVAGTAWHWFDPDRVQEEIRRVLRPGGAVAVVVNHLDTVQEWVHRLTRIMRAGDNFRPGWQPRLDPRHFTPVETTLIHWERRIPVEQILDLATTMSSWLSATEKDRDRRRGNLTWYLYEHLGHAPEQQLRIPYITAWYTAHRCSAAEPGLVPR